MIRTYSGLRYTLFLLLIQPRSTFYTSDSQSTAQSLRGKKMLQLKKKSKKINTFLAIFDFCNTIFDFLNLKNIIQNGKVIKNKKKIPPSHCRQG